jgi:UDP-2,4-diacetamido-2,4,6-trideoxy-beta-L-altropyranose hydrolase
MRCLALARAWQAGGGRSVFLSCCQGKTLCQRLTAEGIEQIGLIEVHPDPEDLKSALQALRGISRTSSSSQETASDALASGWCVLDGYHFDPAYQRALREAGCRLLVIDDTAHWPEYSADILLNQNVTADQLTYRCNPDAVLLLGTRYVLLRPEFPAWRGRKREVPESARRVLVTMGGSDESNVSLQVIQMLQHVGIRDLEVKVLIGPANAHLPVLRDSVGSLGLKSELLTEVTDMPGTMAWADVAISGAGSTCWELAFMGVPSIVLTLADNQAAIAAELHRLGVAVHLGEASQIDRRQFVGHLVQLLASRRAREAMVSRGQGLVDGWGADRVVMRMRGEKLWLRTACAEDARLIWEWANDPGARSVSFSPEPIPWERHVRWFTEKLNDGDCEYYVALNEDETPVGQIRFDVKEKRATVSLSLDSRYRGMGYGSAMIALAARKVFRSREVELIHAYVKMDNAASLRAFSKASFRQDGLIQIRGQAAAQFVLSKDSSR